MPATPGRAATPGCLDDIRVIEIGNERGDFCGMLLAGEGADVIKVEPPEGSPSRRIGPFHKDAPDKEGSLFFWTYNRGKRGVTVDLTTAKGKDAYRELVKTADVVVDAQGVGVMNGLGLGYEAVRALNENVVYCSITDFGLTGPWRDFQASDLVHLALGGSAHCIGYNPNADGKWDTPPFMPQSWHAYAIIGQHASLAIITALFYRQATGMGQFIDAAIHDACAQNTEGTVPRYIYYGTNSPRRFPANIRCADGMYLNGMLSLQYANFPRVLEMLSADGMADDLGDPKYEDAKYRNSAEARTQINDILTRWAESKPAMEAFRGLQECRILCAPVRPPEDLLDDPHYKERGDFAQIEHPELGRSFTYPNRPRRSSETPWQTGKRAPLLGEHNKELQGLTAATQPI